MDKRHEEERDSSPPKNGTAGREQDSGRSEKRDKKQVVPDSGGTKDTTAADARKEIDLHSPATRGSNGSGNVRKQIIKPAVVEEVKVRKVPSAERPEHSPVTPPSPLRSPNQPRRYHPTPGVRDYQKKPKVTANIERIQSIY